MDKFNNYDIGVHHGAREIEVDFLKKTVPGLADLENTIKLFRNVAYKYYKINSKSEYYDEKFNNNISILASRGMGKSSALITIINQIETAQYFNSANPMQKNSIDIINPMIDPEDINENSDLLGWVIKSLELQIDKLENIYPQAQEFQCCFKYNNNKINKLREKKDELTKYYSISSKEYSSVALNKSISTYDYHANLDDILTYDYKLHKCFMEFIDEFIKCKREINNYTNRSNNDEDNEPLIYFFFDDVDMTSKKSIKILTDILSFFSHPNIVIFISGDYKVFEQSLMTYFMKETKEITLKMSDKRKENEIKFAKDRAEYFLKKVLPPSYRYYVQEFSSDASKITHHYHSNYDSIFEKKNILELLSYVFCTGFEKEINLENKTYLRAFIVPKINENDDYSRKEKKYIIANDNIKINYLYAYLSVFSMNIRGFMNVYNYLIKEAKNISEPECKNINKYWNITRFKEFLKVIIDSKHTYQKYENNINKFLTIKSETDNFSQVHTRLRIDCEELEIFISNLMKKLKENMAISLLDNDFNQEDDADYIKNEIKSIIMLPVLINELFYIVCGQNYQQRYLSIKNKLKNILTNVFVNALNNNILLIPKNLGMRRTLCVFYFVISRMGVASLDKLNKYYDVNSANNKKYIVQLYFATIQLGSAGVEKNIEDSNTDDKFGYDFYNVYKESTYTDFDKRLAKEEKIAKKMNKIFKHLDREWLADKIKFATALVPDRFKIENIVHNKFLDMFPYLLFNETTRMLDDMYRYICIGMFSDNNLKRLDNLMKKSGEKEKKIKSEKVFCLFMLEKLFNDNELSNNEVIFSEIINENINENITKIKEKFDELSKKENIINVYENIYLQIKFRLENQFEENEENEKNKQWEKEFLNLFDDFKMQFEVLANRLENLYSNSFDIEDTLYSQIYYYFNIDIDDIDNERVNDKINDNVIEIQLDCLDRDINKLIRDLRRLVNLVKLNSNSESAVLIPKNKNIEEFEEIADYLLRSTRKQQRGSSVELKQIRNTIKNSTRCYYMYMFILEYERITSSNDTQFFTNFKNGIEYNKGENNNG